MFQNTHRNKQTTTGKGSIHILTSPLIGNPQVGISESCLVSNHTMLCIICNIIGKRAPLSLELVPMFLGQSGLTLHSINSYLYYLRFVEITEGRFFHRKLIFH